MVGTSFLNSLKQMSYMSYHRTIIIIHARAEIVKVIAKNRKSFCRKNARPAHRRRRPEGVAVCAGGRRGIEEIFLGK
jgi:hypothetical protein